MSKIRTAHSVMLFERRLGDVERAAVMDGMELIGLLDELQRVERKWLEQIAGGSERRQAGDPKKLDAWFDRLGRQLERMLRAQVPDAALKALLDKAAETVRGRKRLAE